MGSGTHTSDRKRAVRTLRSGESEHNDCIEPSDSAGPSTDIGGSGLPASPDLSVPLTRIDDEVSRRANAGDVVVLSDRVDRISVLLNGSRLGDIPQSYETELRRQGATGGVLTVVEHSPARVRFLPR